VDGAVVKKLVSDIKSTVFQTSKIADRLMAGYIANEAWVNADQRNARRGYMGHLVYLSTVVNEVLLNYPFFAKMVDLPAWEAYMAASIDPERQRQDVQLGGVAPPTRDEEFEQFEPIQNTHDTGLDTAGDVDDDENDDNDLHGLTGGEDGELSAEDKYYAKFNNKYAFQGGNDDDGDGYDDYDDDFDENDWAGLGQADNSLWSAQDGDNDGLDGDAVTNSSDALARAALQWAGLDQQNAQLGGDGKSQADPVPTLSNDADNDDTVLAVDSEEEQEEVVTDTTSATATTAATTAAAAVAPAPTLGESETNDFDDDFDVDWN
jgi:hypothetical protein